MDVFLATLATIIATLLGILLAAVTAYFVFLQERKADYSDRIFAERLAIREQLLSLRDYSRLDTYVPSQFIEMHRINHETASGATLINRLASRLLTFGGSRAETEFLAVDDRYRGRPWKGRLYFALLKEALSVIAPQSGKIEAKRGTFPTAAVETGFAEWRAAYQKLGIRFWSWSRKEMTEDFIKFNLERQDSNFPTPEQAVKSYLSFVDSFFTKMDAINDLLKKIDQLEWAQDRYRPSTFPIKSLSILCSVPFVFGILLPLAMLIRVRPDTPQAAGLMAIALVATILPFVQFGKYVFQSKGSERALYLRLHWYLPMIELTEEQERKFRMCGPLDLEFFLDGRNSDDLNGETLSDLNDYIGVATAYNESVSRFTSTALDLVRNDPILGSSIIEGFNKIGGWGLYPYDLLNQTKIHETVAKLCERPDAGLIINTWIPKLTLSGRPEFAIPMTIGAQRMLEALDSIRKVLNECPVTSEMLRDQTAVIESESRLKERLGDLSQSR